MTKAELRKARKALRTAGRQLTGELALDRDQGPVEWTESQRGQRARERWAHRYIDNEGAGESDDR